MAAEVFKFGVGVVDKAAHCVNGFAEVMGRNFGCHTESDTRRTVYQQLRKTDGQDGRLVQTVVIISHKIDGFLVDIVEHMNRQFIHFRLGITVGGGRVTVNVTEVAVPVNQRIAQRKILRHTNHCVINAGVAVRMISTEHRTDGIGALTVGFIGGQSVFVHSVKNTAVYGFKAVTHIGQRTPDKHRHTVLQHTCPYFVNYFDRPDIGAFVLRPDDVLMFAHFRFPLSLNIQIGRKDRVFFNELSSRFNLVAHKHGKGCVRPFGVLYFNL